MSLFVGDRILVPIDFSQDSFNALDETLNFIKDPNKITVINVLLPLESVDPGVIWSTLNDDTREQNVKTSFYERYPKSLVDNLKLVIKVGNPSLEIVDYAKKNNIDLIVIASHGRTGLNRFLLGSVAEKVVRLSVCPVLVWRDYP
ncbi:universal stress protein [Crocosphaera sp.]|uniref:universal stress protein n=1 Tax=Crocosphaera sp. TaxID=2729996 RepID=UPI002634FE59|nr:universal stress protein [Crocosphaera sp.]MDJ0582067.1 universal stress protein [Crocosphaera sp.]